MANQKAELHNINLKTPEVNLNKYKSDIKPYSGFRKNNSPFYGNVLSPFYGKTFPAIGTNSYVTKDGYIYSLKNGNLVVQKDDDELELSNSNITRFIIRDTMLDSGNDNYPEILAYFHISGSTYEMLCASIEGDYAIINSDGTLKYEWPSTIIERYFPGEKVHFAMYNDYDGSYCFAVGNMAIFISPLGTILSSEQTYDRTAQVNYGCIIRDNRFVVCCNNGDASIIKVPTYSGGTVTWNLVTTLNLVHTNTTTYTDPAGSFKLFFNNSGRAVFTSREYKPESILPRTGKDITLVNNTTISIKVHSYITQIGTDTTQFNLLDTSFSQYSLSAVQGYDPKRSIYHPRRTETRVHTTTTYKKFLWWTYETIKNTWTEEIVLSEAWTEYFSKGYVPILLDGSNLKTYECAAVDETGHYKGGTFQNLGDNVRALFHGGELQGISIADDNETIGTLLCSMSEIDSNYPITVKKVDNVTYIYYKDARNWNLIKVTPDKTKASFKVLNDKYILLNYSNYYNCFNMEDRNWYHFGSDWNDRAIFTKKMAENADIQSFDAYTRNSDSYYFASAQGANYEALDTSIISTVFNAYAAYLPKAGEDIKVNVTAVGTPNGQDVDIYYGKTIDTGKAPPYQFSYDYSSYTLTKYINNRLIGTVYPLDFIMTPSIFATFVKGFINQGIIIDNGHSYIQVYANNIRPVYAINFVSQLEGITGAFIIQGQYYVIINGAIYRYTNGAVEAIVAIDNMRFVGNTPYMALFWSETNRSFYRFTGDNQLYPVVQADEVSEIKDTAFNPNTLSIYIITDVNILIISQDTLIKLPYTEFDRCFPLVHGAAFAGDNSTLEISYNKRDGYSRIPIDLETELYGYGNSVKAVNDCVYLRLYDADRGLGKVTITSETLNEGGKVSNKKEFNITPDMWDKVSNTIFLRYQPGNQDATGFSVHIISPFAIATMQISSQPETVQNSKNNM